jgi:hypothetical protein
MSDLVYRLIKCCNVCVAGTTEISNRELNVTHVDAGSITPVVMLKLKRRRTKCRLERLGLLEEKLQNTLLQIDDVTRKIKALEQQLRLATAGSEVGKRDTVPSDRKGGDCLGLGESIIRIVGIE